MCGLFGFSHYGENKIKNLSELTNTLADQSVVRGTDATGIAFQTGGRLCILKESKSAYMLNFKHDDDIRTMIGHTRHSTQGSEKKNYNNHPFIGNTKNARFALAHNGIISNDKSIRKKYRLPKTKIETDSYIAVQLIESQKDLSFDSIKYMTRQLDGSFSFSVLDDRNNLYLIKGDSPLSVLHFPKRHLYVYASTEEILYKALVDSFLFSDLKRHEFEEVGIQEGEILQIRPDGTLKKDTFPYMPSYGVRWYDRGIRSKFNTSNRYIDDLKSVASCYGYSPDDIDDLLASGYSPEEIEEYLYGTGCEI